MGLTLFPFRQTRYRRRTCRFPLPSEYNQCQTGALMYPFPSDDNLRELIRIAKEEDLRDDDVTSRLMVPEGKIACPSLR